jgi:5'-methylthioadenosine phosphorylase
MSEARVAVIGGSGLYNMKGMEGVREVHVDTPFGRPSDAIILGKLEGVSTAFLPRHGRGHHLMPTEVPSRANIYALKTFGVEQVISVSAVGSLREEMRPGDLVVVDQLIDRTRLRPSTFFGDGIVAHVSFADPFCPILRGRLVQAAREVGADVHDGGTCVAMEGPAFSTRAESHLYRSWGAHVIGMTALPEAKLAREAEMCYATLACVTDYDCWREATEAVTVDVVLEVLRKNVALSQDVLRRAVPNLPEKRECACPTALQNAIVTARDSVPEVTRRRLAPIIGKYLT